MFRFRFFARYFIYSFGAIAILCFILLSRRNSKSDEKYMQEIMRAMPQIGDDGFQRFGQNFEELNMGHEENEDEYEITTQNRKPRRNLPEKIKNEIKNYASEDLIDPPELSIEILELHKKFNLKNPGHLGKPVILPENLSIEYQVKINLSREIYSINEFVSKLIPYYRELPDIRPVYCRELKYIEKLPVTSVIMVFHNEPFTMIMRSVFAVLKRTPPHLLGEIILVDDCSTYDELKKPLDNFILPYKKIRLLRSPVRVGLIKARIFGCVNAKGPALVFMDAHIEVTPGWLEPLIDPIARNPNTTTIPVVDALVEKYLI